MRATTTTAPREERERVCRADVAAAVGGVRGDFSVRRAPPPSPMHSGSCILEREREAAAAAGSTFSRSPALGRKMSEREEEEEEEAK